jgi:chorismate-pyruvate lyase
MLLSLIEGASLREVSVLLAELLRMSPRPLTFVLEDLAGAPVTVDASDPGSRAVDSGRHEDSRLVPGGLSRLTCRTARLSVAGLVAATAELAWLEQRLPWEACLALKQGAEPAGRILARYGMHREDRRALAVWPAEDQIVVTASAVLMIGDCPAGIAYEQVTAGFCELLRARAPRGSVERRFPPDAGIARG